MLEQKVVTIGSDEILIESLPATKALKVLTQLSRIISGVGKGVQDLPSSREEVEQALDLGRMLQGLMEQIDPDETPLWIKQIIRDSIPKWRDKPRQDFDDWYENRFSRGVADQFKLLYSIFEWNYGDPAVWVKKTMAKSVDLGLVSDPGQKEPSMPSETAGEPS